MDKRPFGKGRELLELETVQRGIEEASAWVGAEFTRRTRGMLRSLVGFTHGGPAIESPIEAVFWAWFTALCGLEAEEVYAFSLIPQHTVTVSTGNTFRFDFVVTFGPQDTSVEAQKKNIPEPKVAIELDGHEFHERTKEQVAYRNARDRETQADGWTVLHFSGSELYRDPLQCVQSVLAICRSKTDEWSQAVYGG